MKRVFKLFLTIVVMVTFTFGQTIEQYSGGIYGKRGDFGSCRSTVNWLVNKVDKWEDSVKRLNKYYMEFKNETNPNEKFKNARALAFVINNHLDEIHYIMKNKPQAWAEESVYVDHVRKIFQRDCNGFLKRDKERAKEVVFWKQKEIKLIQKIVFDDGEAIKYFKYLKVNFKGLVDYRPATGYSIP